MTPETINIKGLLLLSAESVSFHGEHCELSDVKEKWQLSDLLSRNTDYARHSEIFIGSVRWLSR